MATAVPTYPDAGRALALHADEEELQRTRRASALPYKSLGCFVVPGLSWGKLRKVD